MAGLEPVAYCSSYSVQRNGTKMVQPPALDEIINEYIYLDTVLFLIFMCVLVCYVIYYILFNENNGLIVLLEEDDDDDDDD